MSKKPARALRDYLSNEWQTLSYLSRSIYEDTSIPIKPERLGRILKTSYPDVIVKDESVRLQSA